MNTNFQCKFPLTEISWVKIVAGTGIRTPDRLTWTLDLGCQPSLRLLLKKNLLAKGRGSNLALILDLIFLNPRCLKQNASPLITTASINLLKNDVYDDGCKKLN